jgi:hypothetical protein
MKSAIQKLNAMVNEQFEKFFKENLPYVRDQLVKAGIPEDKLDEEVYNLRLELQKKCAVYANKTFHEKLKNLSVKKNSPMEKLSEAYLVRPVKSGSLEHVVAVPATSSSADAAACGRLLYSRIMGQSRWNQTKS